MDKYAIRTQGEAITKVYLLRSVYPLLRPTLLTPYTVDMHLAGV